MLELQQGQKINEVEKHVAVLQNEVRNFGQIMTRLDDAISSMTQVSNNVERLLVVHEERIRTTAENLAEHRREVVVMSTDIVSRIDTLSIGLYKRVEDLEKWRWHIGGVWAAIVVMAGVFGKVTGIW